MKKLLITIAILSVLGVGVSSYALWQHYAPLGAAFCNVNETFSCDIVNKSEFSEFLGVPVAGIGLVAYLGFLAVSIGVLIDRAAAPRVLPWLLVAAIGGLGFSAYLTYIEFFVIGAVCILCVTSQALILGISGGAAVAYRFARRDVGATVVSS